MQRCMLTLLFLSFVCSVVFAADCANNRCQNGGRCAEPRQYDSVCIGEYVIYGLSNGKLYAWGSLLAVRSGVEGNPVSRNGVAQVNISVEIAQCKGGLHNTLVLDTSGNAWAWGPAYIGNTFWGLQGMGPNYNVPSKPTRIERDSTGQPFTNIVSIATGPTYSMALNSAGKVFVWGNVLGGLAGDGNTSTNERVLYYPTPVNIAVQTAGSKIIKVSAGTAALALADDGSMYTWGNTANGPGYLGWGCSSCPNTAFPGRVAMPAGADKVIDVYASATAMYALTKNGTLWGWSYRGQWIGVGDGIKTSYPTYTPVNLMSYHKFPFPVRQIVAGQQHSVVILADGTMWAWGGTPNGEVGNGRINETGYIATAVKISSDTDWYDIYAAPHVGFFTFAQKQDGTLFSWGRNKGGALGNGVVPAYGASEFPGDWSIPYPMQVDPYNVNTFRVAPWHCIENPDASDQCDKSNIPVNLCTPSNCAANTRCVLLDNGRRFECDCSTTPTKVGLSCNVSKTAVVPTTGYSCDCPSGFGGMYCERERPADLVSASTSSTTSKSSSSSTTTKSTTTTSQASSASSTNPSATSTSSTPVTSATASQPSSTTAGTPAPSSTSTGTKSSSTSSQSSSTASKSSSSTPPSATSSSVSGTSSSPSTPSPTSATPVSSTTGPLMDNAGVILTGFSYATILLVIFIAML